MAVDPISGKPGKGWRSAGP